jgi:hypothetical protein
MMLATDIDVRRRFIAQTDHFMDRITQSLLAEFSQEHGIEALKEDKRFEHFAAYITLRRYTARYLTPVKSLSVREAIPGSTPSGS